MRNRSRKLERLPPGADSVRLTKKQVVCAELYRAIRLCICDRDYVSAHLLTGAALDIVTALSKKHGVESFSQRMRQIILPEFQDEFFAALNDNYNFLKHGSRVSDATTEYFSVRSVEMALFRLCADFENLFGGYFEPRMFVYYIALRDEGLMDANFIANLRTSPPASKVLDGLGRLPRELLVQVLEHSSLVVSLVPEGVPSLLSEFPIIAKPVVH